MVATKVQNHLLLQCFPSPIPFLKGVTMRSSHLIGEFRIFKVRAGNRSHGDWSHVSELRTHNPLVGLFFTNQGGFLGFALFYQRLQCFVVSSSKHADKVAIAGKRERNPAILTKKIKLVRKRLIQQSSLISKEKVNKASIVSHFLNQNVFKERRRHRPEQLSSKKGFVMPP